MDQKPEPSVLDYLKSRLTPWRGSRVELPPLPPRETAKTGPESDAIIFASLDEITLKPREPVTGAPQNTSGIQKAAAAQDAARPSIFSIFSTLPWRSLLALWAGLVAQVVLQPRPDPERWKVGLFLYLVAFAFLGWALWKGEWSLPALRKRQQHMDPGTARLAPLIVSIILIPLAFLSFGGNQFNAINLLLWAACLVAILVAFWVRVPARGVVSRWIQAVKAPEWRLVFTRWTLLLLAVFALVAFFRIYQLNQVPPEMNSDHAEKLLDVSDVLSGQHRIFFPRNTGREALQFYMIALTSQLLGTGLSFLSMKIGTVLVGLVTLPYIYLLAKEYGGRQAAVLALLLAGVAAWPNILSRVALRFSLYPLFVAPVFYHLLRGLRTGSRNHFILSGVFLGIGLHGYTPMRIVPLLVLAAVGLYILHNRDANLRKRALLGLGVLVAVSFVIFLPLMRFAQENPELFAYRTLTRLLDWESPLPSQISSVTGVFIKNVWNAFTMMGWNSGEIWVVSVPHRPALDVVSAALFYIGFFALLVSYLRTRRWEHLLLALSVPLLQLPSSLSIAFPLENPAPNRLGGALVPVFVIASLAFAAFLQSLYKKATQSAFDRHALPVVLTGLLLLVILSQNYDLVFKQYARGYSSASWNSSEIGQVIRDYITMMGEPDTAWVVAMPHWLDTRLVGIVAGQPARDYAVFPENIPAVAASDERPKLYILRADDIQDLQTLQQLYPQHTIKEYHSAYENKNFLMFFAPGPSTNVSSETLPDEAQSAPGNTSTPTTP